jgi:hypothetical protein
MNCYIDPGTGIFLMAKVISNIPSNRPKEIDINFMGKDYRVEFDGDSGKIKAYSGVSVNCILHEKRKSKTIHAAIKFI